MCIPSIRACRKGCEPLLRSIRMIAGSLSHITRDKVVTVLAGTNSEEFIRNQKGKYFHESIVEFTTDEMIKIVKWINEAIADKEYISYLGLH